MLELMELAETKNWVKPGEIGICLIEAVFTLKPERCLE